MDRSDILTRPMIANRTSPVEWRISDNPVPLP